jgi:adenine-specific DNA methylase
LAQAWHRLTYDKKITYCLRPEEAENIASEEWEVINAHLGTKATNLQELVEQLGIKKFGRRAVVGDCFCGGGSIPFEAARMGNDVFASDLNPIAGLLTWADLNIAGASDEEIKELRKFQEEVYKAVDKQVKEWGIEINEQGDRANSYLYCNETICPECGYKVPLAPSWIIGKATMTIAILKDNGKDGFDIEIKSGATAKEMKEADEKATVVKGNMYCPHCEKTVPISAIRRDTSEGYGLRQWRKDEFIPCEDDVFQERLYCIRYEHEEKFIDKKGKGKVKRTRYYVTPTENDLKREKKVVSLLSDKFKEWQECGYIPFSEIEEGEKTNELMRTRGWNYWHQLFNPRQLLVLGLLMEKISEKATSTKETVACMLAVNRCADWNSKLCRWENDDHHTNKQTFYNQAFNTLFNYSFRGFYELRDIWKLNVYIGNKIMTNTKCNLFDARIIEHKTDIWVTDPPYADAVNYHELSEFFLA